MSPSRRQRGDGEESLFDLNFAALGIAPDECFRLANERQLKPGRELKVHLASRPDQAA